MATLPEIWTRANGPPEAVALMRAYYRSGQLVEVDCFWALSRIPPVALQERTLEGFKVVVLRNLLQTASLEDLPSGGWAQARFPEDWYTRPSKLYRQVLAFIIATLMYPKTMVRVSLPWVPWFDLLAKWVVRALPTLRTSNPKETKRAVLTYLRLHASVVVDWTILLSTVLSPSTGTLQLNGERVDSTIKAILSGKEWPETWDRYMNPTQPTAPAKDQISFLEVQRRTINVKEMVLWMRAYYRTGQLRLIDQALLAAVIWDTRLFEDTGDIERPPRDFGENYFVAYERSTQPGQVAALVRSALSELSPQQLTLYRVYEFLTYVIMISESPLIKAIPGTRYGNNFIDVGEMMESPFMEAPVLGPSSVLPPYVQLWEDTLTKLSDRATTYSYVATIKAMYEQSLHYLLHTFEPLFSRQDTKLLHPILQAYCELLQATLAHPVDPIGYRLQQGTNFPQLYAAVQPMFPEEAGFQLPPVLNQLVYGYALAPTYDQVLRRLPTLVAI